jgi:hypothetical protein
MQPPKMPLPTPLKIPTMENFKTGEIESFPDNLTDEKAKEYIPQERAHQTLYDLSRLEGLSALDALIKVLKLSVGVK